MDDVIDECTPVHSADALSRVGMNHFQRTFSFTFLLSRLQVDDERFLIGSGEMCDDYPKTVIVGCGAAVVIIAVVVSGILGRFDGRSDGNDIRKSGD